MAIQTHPCEILWNVVSSRLISPRVNGRVMLFLSMQCSRTLLIHVLCFVCICGTRDNASFFSSTEVEVSELHTVGLHENDSWERCKQTLIISYRSYISLDKKANSDFSDGCIFLRFVFATTITCVLFTTCNVIIYVAYFELNYPKLK